MPTLNGWRGAGLLVIALASCAGRGVRYTLILPEDLPAGIYDLSIGGLVIRVLGVLWFVAAALGVWCAFRVRDLPGIFALAFMHALWAVALALGWLFDSGDWLSPLTSLGYFGLIVCWSRMVNPPSADVDVEQLLAESRGGE